MNETSYKVNMNYDDFPPPELCTGSKQDLTELYSQLVNSYYKLSFTVPGYGFSDGTTNLDNTLQIIIRLIKKIIKHYV